MICEGSRQSLVISLSLGVAMLCGPIPAQAEQLYDGSEFSAMVGDQRASRIGDIVTILIAESSRSSSRLQNNSARSTDIGGGIRVSGLNENASLEFGGSYSGRGEVVRSDQFVAQMSAQIVEVFANGDLLIEGQQDLSINGEETRVSVRGRVRRIDISEANNVLSSRLAQAEIDYNGEGFVSRSARPGIVNRIFSFLGIG